MMTPKDPESVPRNGCEEQARRQIVNILESITEAFVAYDQDWRFTYVNSAAERILGVPRAELLGKNHWEICPLSVGGEVERLFRQVMARREPAELEYRHRLQDRWFDTWLALKIYPSEDGGIAVFFRDITEQKRTEASLRQLSQAIEQSPVSIVITDTTGAIEFVNRHFSESTGYALAEVRGENSRILKSGETSLEEYRRLWQTISAGGVWRGEFHNRKKNGELFWEQATIAPLKNADNVITHYVAFKEDISEHKSLAEQFRQAQKIESVGRLAGGVAHDFNNMLGVILGRTELALSKLTADQPLFASLLEIRKAAERSADLTRQLLAFARKQTIAPKEFDLNQALARMLKMLRRLIGEDIDLAWLPEAGELPIRIDPSQLDQVLANLCVNARDAIVGVGKLTIETHRVSFDAAYCAHHPEFVPGDFVQLAVSDNGCGMDHATLGQIFEPYFTTKGLGKGTGLGLATVYGIVRQNNGFINVYSEPGRGTTFKIYLPRLAVSTEQLREESPLRETRGDETILLVEDEPAYLEIARQMLASFGYQVLAAATPGEAIRIAKEYPAEIQLLMTDLVMPEMNGRELAKTLHRLRPEIRQLFMSGYTSDVIAHHGVLEEGVKYIQKPFSLQDLAAKVREALEES
jgi:PAS domain S-box-containing protein